MSGLPHRCPGPEAYISALTEANFLLELGAIEFEVPTNCECGGKELGAYGLTHVLPVWSHGHRKLT